jgi:hyperosmotically inducible periplasmic protein
MPFSRICARLAMGLLAATLLFVRPVAAQISDSKLGDRVADAVRRCPSFSIFDDVTVGVSNRNVTINGWVTEPFKRDDITRRVNRVDGIRTLTNAIVVLPVSESDRALRQRLAKAIYGNSMFWRYASSANPPIHIIVEAGHVTLTGAVLDENEKSFAFALAHVSGVMSVKNELRIDKD